MFFYWYGRYVTILMDAGGGGGVSCARQRGAGGGTMTPTAVSVIRPGGNFTTFYEHKNYVSTRRREWVLRQDVRTSSLTPSKKAPITSSSESSMASMVSSPSGPTAGTYMTSRHIATSHKDRIKDRVEIHMGSRLEIVGHVR